jgi:hypothetical protein
MTSPSIAIPQPTRLPRSLVGLAAAVVVAVIVTMGLMFSSAGHSTTHAPAFGSGQSRNASSDCLVRIPDHPC